MRTRVYSSLAKWPQVRTALKKCYVYLRRIHNTYRIRGHGNSLHADWAILNKVDFDVRGNNNRIIIGDDTVMNGVRFYVRGSNHKINIGSNCRFERGGTIWFEDNDCLLRIGDNTTIEEAHIALTEPGSSIEIGDNCMLAYDIDVRCGDSHSIIDLQSKKRINYAKDIRIGDHVWLAAHVQVLKGVTIGSDSIVAIRSVVTKDVPPNSIAAGIPAEVVKTSVTWERRRTYER